MRHPWMIFAMLGLALGTGPVLAASWRVERDGSGDFIVIQEAVDAAAAGDSILIGPGLYMEYQSVTLPGWGWPVNVYANVTVDDLTFIGAGREQTIIGPREAYFQGFGPMGIAAVNPAVVQFRVENLGLRNLYDGIHYSDAHADVVNCQFLSCEFGVQAIEVSLSVDSCRFVESGSRGILTYDSNNIAVMHSDFVDCRAGVATENSTNCTVTDCTFQGGRLGIQFASGSSGGVYGCTLVHFEDYSSIRISTASFAEVIDNTVTGNGTQLSVVANSHVVGSGNVLNGGSYSTIRSSNCTLDLHGNHILNAGGHSVLLVALHPPVATIDMSGNYWGATDPAQIDEWIWDHNDDAGVYAVVDYEPFAEAPIGIEQQTWGAIKALFYNGGK